MKTEEKKSAVEKTFRPRAIIFDMVGLMLDTEKPFIRFWNELGKKYGYNIPHETVIRMIGLNAESARKLMIQEYGQDFPYDKMRDEIRILYEKEFEDGVPLKKGLVNLLDHLFAANIPLGVATSSRKARATEMLDKADVLKYFTAVTGGDEVENGKPAPDVFLLAARRLGQSVCHCVGFEDSTAGLKGLHAAGIKSIFIKDIVEPPPEILAFVWRKLNDLTEAVQLFDL
jgi:HAD superfamily hydrolase (TIGR01509 family)